MRVVCYYLTFSGNRNVVLLVNLKDAPGVTDGDSMLGEVWEVDLCGALPKIDHWNQLNVYCERD